MKSGRECGAGTRRPLSMELLVLAVVLGMGGAPAQSGEGDLRRDSTVIAVEKVLPAVVNIGTLTRERADPYDQMMRDFFGYGRRAPDTVYSSGSGVVIDEEGWVLTNFHVVRDAVQVRVTVAGEGEPIEARVIAASEANDLALIRLEGGAGRRFRAVSFAGADDLLLGETVIAMGNPYGLGGSVSRGILSSKTRRTARDGETMEVEDWLQTDAAINPGNSGGPLVNLRGELIGINVAVLAQAQGIGFAIPVKRIEAVLSEMCAPEVTRGLWFGAVARGTRPPVVIDQVRKGSPAETAGLHPGDEVISVDGQPVPSLVQFYREVGTASGGVSKVGVRRNGERRELTVRLVDEAKVFHADYVRERTGMLLERLPEDLGRQLRLNPSMVWLVAGVDSDGPAEAAGVRKGQFVTAIEGQAAGDLVGLGRLLSRRKAGEHLGLELLTARRRGMVVQIGESRARLRLR